MRLSQWETLDTILCLCQILFVVPARWAFEPILEVRLPTRFFVFVLAYMISTVSTTVLLLSAFIIHPGKSFLILILTLTLIGMTISCAWFLSGWRLKKALGK